MSTNFWIVINFGGGGGSKEREGMHYNRLVVRWGGGFAVFMTTMFL